MKIAFLADSHYDETGRFHECCRLHNWIAADAAARGCKALLHGGDLYERRSTPREREEVAHWLRGLHGAGIPFVGVRGNHDAPGDVSYLRHLTPEPDVYEIPAVNIHSVPGVTIVCLPWPSRAGILAEARSREEGEQTIQEAVRNVLRGIGNAAHKTADPVLFLGHCMVRDSRTSTGQPLVGCDVEVGLEDLALVGADAYLLGHIHMHQHWEIDGRPCIYPGSPRRTAFGESEAKGYVVLDMEPGEPVRWEFVEAPATPMVDVRAEWATQYTGPTGEESHPAFLAMGTSEHCKPDNLAGCEVRLRYSVEPEHREAAKAAARSWAADYMAAGAVSVKVEEQVEATTRARAPEVATAPTVPDKLRALWAARGETVSRAEQLIAMSVSLEEEVRCA
jgi:predicted phosphodiesterase